MSALKSVALAIDVATQKRDQAGRYLVQAQRACLFAQNQLDQLESYAADSEARWTASAQIATTPALLQHHYQFMGRLRHAINLQLGVMADLEFQLEAAKKRTLDAEFRLAGLQKVMKNKKADIAVKTNRREQKQMDEFAAMQFARTARRPQWGDIS
jgi:flagellar protein FliJ